MRLMLNGKVAGGWAAALLIALSFSTTLFTSQTSRAVTEWQLCYDASGHYDLGGERGAFALYTDLTIDDQHAIAGCFSGVSGIYDQTPSSKQSSVKTPTGIPVCTLSYYDDSYHLKCINPANYSSTGTDPLVNTLCAAFINSIGAGAGTTLPGYDACASGAISAYNSCSTVSSGSTGTITLAPADVAACIKTKTGTSVPETKIIEALSQGSINTGVADQGALQTLQQACVASGGTWDAAASPQCKQPVTATANGEPPAPTCKVEGIGWILCPVINFLSTVADGAMTQLQTLMELKSSSYFQAGGDAYKYWDVMRSYANIIFVAAFIMIILSQVTSIGLSNYGIKKLLPKLIVVALLVNISWYICALAVDLSNFLGYTLPSVFNASFANIGMGKVNVGSVNDGSLLQVGGAALILGITAAGAAVATAYFFIAAFLGIVLTFIVTIITVVVVLTIRQAAVVVLVVVSPIAFACMLLPNTQAVFKKWMNIFKALLVLFPVVGLLYGGAKLASKVIVTAGTESGNPFLQLIGSMLPFLVLIMVITLTKKALDVIDGLDGVANGIANRGSKANQALLGGIRKRDQENRQILGNRIARSGLGQPFVRGAARRKAHIDAQKAEIDAIGKQGLVNDRRERGQNWANRQKVAETQSSNAQLGLGNAAQQHLNTYQGGALVAEEGRLKEHERALNIDADTIKIDASHTEFSGAQAAEERKALATKDRELTDKESVLHDGGERLDIQRQILAQGSRQINLEREIKSDYAEALNGNAGGIQDLATGIGGDAGRSRVLAAASAELSKVRTEAVTNARVRFQTAPNDDEARLIATTGRTSTGADATAEEIEAATTHILERGKHSDKLDVVQSIATATAHLQPGEAAVVRSGLADAYVRSSLADLGGKEFAGQIRDTGTYPSPDFNAQVRSNLDKLKPEAMAKDIKYVNTVISAYGSATPAEQAAMAPTLNNLISTIRGNSTLSSSADTATKSVIDGLATSLGAAYTGPTSWS